MHKLIAAGMIVTLALTAGNAEAKPDAEAQAKAIAPYLDAQTVALLHVDLGRLDLEPLLSTLAKLAKQPVEVLFPDRREFQDLRDDLVRAKATDLYVVLSLADLPTQPPLFVVPLAEGADAKGLLRDFRRSRLFARLQFEARGQTVVGGSEAALRRLRDVRPAPRPELSKAFAAVGEDAVQMIFILSAETRRVFEELLPPPPGRLGGPASLALIRGIPWLAVGLNGPPHLSLRMVMQATDNDTAKKLQDLSTKALQAIGQHKEVQKLFPDQASLAEQLLPRLADDRLVLTLDEKSFLALVQPAVVRARSRASRMQSMNNMKQEAIAMHNYADTYKSFPPAASFDESGKPLLSWRVHILPYLEQSDLYKQFHLDEPWDSEHNKKLIARMPAVYRRPGSTAGAGMTTYLVPVGGATIFPGTSQGMQFRDITDGTSNTIMLVDASDDQAVIWTKPEDWRFDPQQPARGLGGADGGFLACFADGSVRFIKLPIDPAVLRVLFTRNGGEPVGMF